MKTIGLEQETGMKQGFINRFFRAINVLILVSAITHMLVLVIYAFKTGEFVWLNYFNILEIDVFFPRIIEGPFSMIMATTLMVVIALVAYLLSIPKKSNK